MKRFLLLFLLTAMLQITFANPAIVQKLILKNGSELEGYISMQRPGTNFTFTTERAIIYLDGKEIKTISDQEINIKYLSPEWIKWAEENDAFVGLGDNRSLTLSNIVLDNKTISKVRILEKGAQVKYLELANNTYSLNWDTISLIKADKRSKTALTGINRVYKLKNGQEFEGQYVQEIPGKTLSLYRDNGVIEVFETNEVIKYSMRKINPNQSLFEQSNLVDIIQLKDGSSKRGIIIEQNYSDNSSNNYLLIESENGDTQSIKMSDIVEYRKEINKEFKPQFDILLKSGELVINRQATCKVDVIEADNGYIYFEKDTCCMEIVSNTPVAQITVETNLNEGNENIPFEVVRLIPGNVKKKMIYGISYKDIVKNNLQPSSQETSINNTTKLTYRIPRKGIYAIYYPKERIMLPFVIK